MIQVQPNRLRTTALVGLLLCAALAAGQDAPTRIPPLGNGVGSFLIAARNAVRKGDLLTIVVNEAMTNTQTATTTATKKDTSSTAASVLPVIKELSGALLTGIPNKIVNALFGSNSTGADSSVNGSGTANASSSFTAKVAVVVTDVMPNGNLIVQGTRTLRTNKETQVVTLTGIVRPDDVQADNTVSSQAVADFRVFTEGTGLIADRQRRGFLTRILEWLF